MSVNEQINFFVKRIGVLFMRLRGEDFYYDQQELETPRGWLKLLDVVGADVIASGLFLGIAWSKWQRISCTAGVSLQERAACFLPAALPCAMVLVIGLVFALSRRSAKKELAISEKLFPPGRLPDQWILPTDKGRITFSVTLFFVTYVVLAWVSDKIVIVTCLMLLIACNDLNTIRWIKHRADKYLSDERYAPTREDRDFAQINKRREIIRTYFYTKPHYWKEGGRIAGCASAVVVALVGFRSEAYIVLMTTLIGNEVITAIWRKQRDNSWLALQPIEKEQTNKTGRAARP